MSKPDFSTNILDWHWVRKAKQKKQNFLSIYLKTAATA